MSNNQKYNTEHKHQECHDILHKNMLEIETATYRISSINSDTLIIRTPKFLEKIIIFCTFNNSNTLF